MNFLRAKKCIGTYNFLKDVHLYRNLDSNDERRIKANKMKDLYMYLHNEDHEVVMKLFF